MHGPTVVEEGDVAAAQLHVHALAGAQQLVRLSHAHERPRLYALR